MRATKKPADASAADKAFLDMLGVLAKFETNLGRERQMEGIQAAKARGVYEARKPRIDPAEVRRLHEVNGLSSFAIARRLSIALKRVQVPAVLRRPVASIHGAPRAHAFQSSARRPSTPRLTCSGFSRWRQRLDARHDHEPTIVAQREPASATRYFMRLSHS